MSSKFASFVSQVPSNGERPSLSARTSFTNETHMKEATPSDTQPFVDGATTTTIFMNRDGRGMKAPVVVNSHRLRLSPDAERLVGANTSPEDSHPVNTELDAENVGSSEAVSSYMSSTQVSTPKVSSWSSHPGRAQRNPIQTARYTNTGQQAERFCQQTLKPRC